MFIVVDNDDEFAYKDEGGSEANTPAGKVEVIQNQPHDEAMELDGESSDESVPSPSSQTNTQGVSPEKGGQG